MQFTPYLTRILRNMKSVRQVEAVEAVELMVSSNTITMAHAESLLKATPPLEQRTDV